MRVVCAVHCIAGPALLHQHLFVIVVIRRVTERDKCCCSVVFMTIVSYDKNYEIASSSITICGRISSDNLFVIFL